MTRSSLVRSLLLSLALLAPACSEDPTFVELTVDRAPVESDREIVETRPAEGGALDVTVGVGTSGPEGVADAGISRHVHLTLTSPGDLEVGEELAIATGATLVGPEELMRAPHFDYDIVMRAEEGHDPRVERVWADSACFCAASTRAEQEVRGTLRVVERTEGTLRVAVDLAFQGRIPGEDADRYEIDAVVDVALPR